MPIGPCGAPYKDDGAGGLKQDKNPHGAVWGAVGNHGYREVGGAVCIPAGRNTEVNIAIELRAVSLALIGRIPVSELRPLDAAV